MIPPREEPRRNIYPEDVRLDRVLNAIETIMALDDSAEFRAVARRRYIEMTERMEA